MKKSQTPVDTAPETESNAVIAEQTPVKAEQKAAKAEQPTDGANHAEPTFTVAQLRPNARVLFGISLSAFDGATYGVDAGRKFTVAAMKDHIEKWMKEGN